MQFIDECWVQGPHTLQQSRKDGHQRAEVGFRDGGGGEAGALVEGEEGGGEGGGVDEGEGGEVGEVGAEGEGGGALQEGGRGEGDGFGFEEVRELVDYGG